MNYWPRFRNIFLSGQSEAMVRQERVEANKNKEVCNEAGSRQAKKV